MLKRTFLAAVITALLIPSVVSCGDNGSGSSESTQASSTAPTGAAAIDALKEIAGESLKEKLKEVPTLQSNPLPEDAKEIINSCIVSMYCSDAEETLKYLFTMRLSTAIKRKILRLRAVLIMKLRISVLTMRFIFRQIQVFHLRKSISL